MIFAAYFILTAGDRHIDFPRTLFLVGVISPLMQDHSLWLKKLTSQAPEVAMLEIIRRPVYKRLFKSNRMLRVDQKSNVNKTCQQSLFSPIYRSLHQGLMHSGCCGTTISNVCLQAPTLSLPSPHDFFTRSPNREPVHRLKPFRTFNRFSDSYLQS